MKKKLNKKITISVLIIIIIILGFILIPKNKSQQKKEPQNYTAGYYMDKGLTEFNQSQFEKAKEDFDKAIEMNPKIAYFYLQRAITNAKLGDIENAKKDVEQVLILKPDSKSAQSLKEALNKR